jgi:hypothetical protein
VRNLGYSFVEAGAAITDVIAALLFARQDLG